jgi:hypothetical protein
MEGVLQTSKYLVELNTIISRYAQQLYVPEEYEFQLLLGSFQDPAADEFFKQHQEELVLLCPECEPWLEKMAVGGSMGQRQGLYQRPSSTGTRSGSSSSASSYNSKGCGDVVTQLLRAQQRSYKAEMRQYKAAGGSYDDMSIK